jgi:hypothetical protein
MKSTSYFNHIRQRPDRAFIKIEWIKQAIEKPIAENIESDGRIRRWTWVEEEEKFLRVILLKDGETVHNAFFDRRFRV